MEGQMVSPAGWSTFILPVLLLAIFLWAAASILRKAGYSGWWCLLMVVPLVNLVGLVLLRGLTGQRCGRIETLSCPGRPTPAEFRLRATDSCGSSFAIPSRSRRPRLKRISRECRSVAASPGACRVSGRAANLARLAGRSEPGSNVSVAPIDSRRGCATPTH